MQSSSAETEMFDNVKDFLWFGDISWRKEKEEEEEEEEEDEEEDKEEEEEEEEEEDEEEDEEEEEEQEEKILRRVDMNKSGELRY